MENGKNCMSSTFMIDLDTADSVGRPVLTGLLTEGAYKKYVVTQNKMALCKAVVSPKLSQQMFSDCSYLSFQGQIRGEGAAHC